MQVYVQKSTRTTLPRRPSAVSGSELSQPVAPSNPGRVSRRVPKRLTRDLPLSAKRPEGRSHFGRKELRLLPGGEVPAPLDLVGVGDVGITGLDPAARALPNLAGERGEADREHDLGRSLAGRCRSGCKLSVLPIRPSRRGPGSGQPVHRDVVE